MFDKNKLLYRATVGYRIINKDKLCCEVWDVFKRLDDAIDWANNVADEDGCYKELTILVEEED